MRIIQISDLHVGSQFVPEKFDTLLSEINAMRPDAVVVTGDLTNEGLVKEYERSRQLLSKIETGRLIAISGNHDYRNTGYLLFKKYFPLQTINELGRNVVLVTVGTARPDRNDGEVGYRQNLWIGRTLQKYKQHIKIVAMHHHLIAIPDTGSDQLTVADAGDVLRTVLRAGVDVVLCGHKHRPWVWAFGGLTVVNAGTATSERVRGFFENTYNIIEIDEEARRVEIDLKIVGGRRVPMREIVERYDLYRED